MTSQDPRVQVEVSIQDYYSQPAESDFHSLDYRVQTEIPIAETVELPSPETWATWFKAWLEILEPNISASQAYELSLRLTSDQEIRSLNAQYCQNDQPTDVLAFAALEADCPQPSDQMPVYLGDIVISVDTALQQANAAQISLKRELAWLATHGLLHLLGWDHPDKASLAHMLHQQDHLLKAANFPIESEPPAEFFTLSHVFKQKHVMFYQS